MAWSVRPSHQRDMAFEGPNLCSKFDTVDYVLIVHPEGHVVILDQWEPTTIRDHDFGTAAIQSDTHNGLILWVYDFDWRLFVDTTLSGVRSLLLVIVTRVSVCMEAWKFCGHAVHRAAYESRVIVIYNMIREYERVWRWVVCNWTKQIVNSWRNTVLAAARNFGIGLIQGFM